MSQVNTKLAHPFALAKIVVLYNNQNKLKLRFLDTVCTKFHSF
jgi:hypothetical protein